MAVLASAITVDIYHDPNSHSNLEFAFKQHDTINYGYKELRECGNGFGVWFYKTDNLNKTMLELINSGEQIEVNPT
eukprot:CAMPEP_0170479496 /NCGR_PEP_ID=MMETSP0208-20121228/709_1 /TAXON_ID=197538 /ORGANISM="Strombidium inclinatum, Strain S3" /LENGTH=75 /DNA_ID=CAMNT_0010751899 /DNA_START=48 /DNA_END=275 /DNA_ORIENTATION=+